MYAAAGGLFGFAALIHAERTLLLHSFIPLFTLIAAVIDNNDAAHFLLKRDQLVFFDKPVNQQ